MLFRLQVFLTCWCYSKSQSTVRYYPSKLVCQKLNVIPEHSPICFCCLLLPSAAFCCLLLCSQTQYRHIKVSISGLPSIGLIVMWFTTKCFHSGRSRGLTAIQLEAHFSCLVRLSSSFLCFFLEIPYARENFLETILYSLFWIEAWLLLITQETKDSPRLIESANCLWYLL